MSLVCLSSANCLRAFLCIIFRRGFLLGRQPCRPIWCSVWRMVWALTRWPPTPLTSAAMLAALIRLFRKHNLWIWRTCTQLLWSTMARPVLSGTCPVKPLYGLGHRAAAQFQGLGNLLIAYTIFMKSNNSFFSDPQRVLCHEVPCWTSSDQYERVRAITPNLTHLLPIHTWDLVTLTSHITPGRENG